MDFNLEEKPIADPSVQILEEQNFLCNRQADRRIDLSEWLHQYQNLMNLSDENLQQRNQIREKDSQLIKSDNISVQLDEVKGLSFQIIESSKNGEIILLMVTYGCFTFVLSILITDYESPIHNINQRFQGSFATTYRAQMFKQEVAIKCHHLAPRKNQKDETEKRKSEEDLKLLLVFVVKEYALLCVASRLQAGPYLPKSWGFDIIVYKDCIEFMMEYCEQDVHMNAEVECQLIHSLSRLHNFNIIHFDIKSANICFSPKFRKAVFIDFGLSQIIGEEVGFKSKLTFRGSLSYCSDQMSKCYVDGVMFIDAYFNDIICLKKSCKQLLQNQADLDLRKDQICLNLTKEYLPILLKFYLFDSDDQFDDLSYQQKCIFFDRFKDFIMRNYRESVKETLANRPLTRYSAKISKQYLQSTYEKQMKVRQNFVYFGIPFQAQSEEKNSQLVMKRHQIIEDICEAIKSRNKQQLISTLSCLEKVKLLEQHQYYLMLANSLRLDCNQYSYEQKVELSKVFFIKNERQCQIDQIIASCISQLFDYALSEELTQTKGEILQQIIISIFITQTKSLEQIERSYQAILNTEEISIQKKGEVIFYFLNAGEWSHCRITSIYGSDRLEYILWKGLEIWLTKLTQQDVQKVDYLKLVLLLKKQGKVSLSQSTFSQRMSQSKQTSFKFNDKIKLKSCFHLQLEIFCKYLVNEYNYHLSNFHQYYFFQTLQRALFRFSYYHPHIFHFAYFAIFDKYKNKKTDFQVDAIYQRYCNFFSAFSFFKYFYIHIDYQIRWTVAHYEKTEELNLNEKKLLDISRLLQKSNIYMKMRYGECYTRFVETLTLTNEQIIENLSFKKGFWNAELAQLFDNNHRFSFDKEHKLYARVKQFYDYLIQQMDTSFGSIIGPTSDEIMQQFNNFYQQLIPLANALACFTCKALIYFEIERVNITILTFTSRFEEAFDLFISYLVACFKDVVLSSIKPIHSTFIQHSQITPEFSLLCFYFIKINGNKNLFDHITTIILLKNIYRELFRRSQFDDLIWLIQKLMDCFLNQMDKDYINQFEKQMMKLVDQYLQQNDGEYFFTAHLLLIERLRYLDNPYLAVYYIIVMKARSQQLKGSFIYRFIAKSINNLDLFARKIILEKFYAEVQSNFSPMKYRRSLYLKKYHNKSNGNINIQKYIQSLGKHQMLRKNCLSIKIIEMRRAIAKYCDCIKDLSS